MQLELATTPSAVLGILTVPRFGTPHRVNFAVEPDQVEQKITLALLAAIIARCDRFGARAFDIPREERHTEHARAIDRWVGMVAHLTDDTGGLASLPDCVRYLNGGLPLGAFLLGMPGRGLYAEREAEWIAMKRNAAVLAERVAHPGPSCHRCLLPRAHALCTCRP